MYMRRTLLFISCCLLTAFQVVQAQRIRENFDFDWQFHLGECVEAVNPNYVPTQWEWEKVQLPHDWSIYLPFEVSAGGSSGYLPGGIGLYRKEFYVPSSYKGKKISIVFDGIYHKATIYINGNKVGYHRYGYTSFEYDLTDYMEFGKNNVIFVHVDHAEESRWYTGSGIYRHAWLQITDPIHVATWGTYITTPEISEESANVNIVTSIVNSTDTDKQLKVVQTLVGKDGKSLKIDGKKVSVEGAVLVAANDTTDFAQQFSISSPELWSIDNPHLYSVQTTIKSGSRTLDSYTTDFGVRYFEFNNNTGFWLNGENVKLKGVCLHQDAGSFGAGVPDRSYERRLQILKEFGVNAIRCSHNPPSPEFLQMCDTLGFVVMDEAFDKWDSGYYAEFYHTSWKQDIKDMIVRDRNHPSIVMWSIGNEVQEAFDNSVGPQRAKIMQDYVHELEPSRPVCLAGQQGFTDEFGSVTDIMGYNYLENRLIADHKRFPERVMIVTEAFPFYSGMRQNDVRDYVDYAPWNFVKDNDFIAGSFLWAGVDYIGEASAWPSKGWSSCPFDMCMFEKPEAAYLRSVWNDEPFMRIMVRDNSYDIPAGKDHWQYPPMADNWMLPYIDERCVEVRTVTNCDSVKLFGPHWDGSMKDFGFRKTADYDNNTIIWNQPYRKDRIVYAIAYKDGVEVCRDTLQAHTEAVKVVLEPDVTRIKADGQDLSHIKLTLYDENGIEAQTDNRRVTVRVTGEGVFRCLDTGDLRREGSFAGNSIKTYFGKALIVVQSTRKVGEMQVEVEVEGFDKPFILPIYTEQL